MEALLTLISECIEFLASRLMISSHSFLDISMAAISATTLAVDFITPMFEVMRLPRRMSLISCLPPTMVRSQKYSPLSVLVSKKIPSSWWVPSWLLRLRSSWLPTSYHSPWSARSRGRTGWGCCWRGWRFDFTPAFEYACSRSGWGPG